MIRKGNFKVESGSKQNGRNRKKDSDVDSLSDAPRRDSQAVQRGGKRRAVYKSMFMEIIKKKCICVFKSYSNDFVVLGSNRIAVRRSAGSQ